MARVPPHPTRPLAFALIACGGAFAAIAGGPIGIPFGVSVAALGVFQWRLGKAVMLANSAAAAINRGETAVARELVAEARRAHRLTYVVRLLDAHEAEIAWREGDLEAARRHLETARARRELVPVGMYRHVHVAHVEALLAVVAAAQGDEKGARVAIDAVRGSKHAQSTALARAELAEALLLARGGRLDDLHRHLAHHHVLLAEGTEPRGRVLLRALRRMTASRSTSAYRIPVRASAPREGATTSWVARVFPAAAPLVEDAGETPAATLATVDASNTRAAEPTVAAKNSAGKRLLALWALVVVMLVVVWQLGRDAPIPWEPGVFVVGMVGLFVAVFAFFSVRARRAIRALEEAYRCLAHGDLEEAERVGRAFRDDANGIVKASASLLVALALERRARFGDALAEIDRALAGLSGYVQRAGTSDLLLPQIVSARAQVLAALGREPEAEAELARLTREFPTFPYQVASVLRTRLILAARRGDLAGVAEIARARGDVSLGASGEILADLALAARSNDPDELRAARADLLEYRHAEVWVRAVAPELVEHAQLAGRA